MKEFIVLCSLCLVSSARAGSRSAGTGAGAITIPADALNAGGGNSGGGTGGSAVTLYASVGGIAGTVSVAAPATSVMQGYIPQILPPPLKGYELWASQNIAPGQASDFGGDADRDGIPNGVAYALGGAGIAFDNTALRFRITYPASIPPDVNLYLERSLTLAPGSWSTIVSWVDGAAPVAGSGVEILTRIRDTILSSAPKAYYRYRAVRR